MQESNLVPNILLPDLPGGPRLDHVVLFGFDDWAFPFREHVETHLSPRGKSYMPRLVLPSGPEGSHDEHIIYYGSVIRIGQTFHMWYGGNYGPVVMESGLWRRYCCVCYATSTDGIHWEKPELGLVEFNGSKKNNIVDLPWQEHWCALAVLYDPEDTDPDRRFKMAYTANITNEQDKKRFHGTNLCWEVAFSPDGLSWKPSKLNPMGGFFELAGLTKHRSLYYVNGQAGLSAHHPARARRLVTYASADFEHWSPCGVVGLDRGPDVYGPSMEADLNCHEEVHMGAGLWNRGNVIVGIYGQWRGDPGGDRRMVMMDLGLAVSHDAIHFREPIPGFPMICAREQPGADIGFYPALMHGQGMENIGDQTLYWYSFSRVGSKSGVLMVSWPRDRLGMLKPFKPYDARTISCPIQVRQGQAEVFVNASGLGQNSRLRIGLADEGFRPIDGYSGSDAAVIDTCGFHLPVKWKQAQVLSPSHGVVRLDIQFEGVRPEDAQLHTVYVETGK